MIFLSHNHKDKDVVEQFAIRLRDVFGQDQIFYDSWSMQPGDGIIDKMSEGLGDCKLFLFFVSKNSLQSNMVKLEWQNAVMKATTSETKIIPIKLDDCLMPAILLQTLYIDLFTVGLEVALRQVVDVAEGKNTFTAGPHTFVNVRAYTYQKGESVKIEMHAEHYLEPISNYLILTDMSEDDVRFVYAEVCISGFQKALPLNDGSIHNAQSFLIQRSTVPGFPIVINASSPTNKPINIVGVMHEKQKGKWEGIPLIQGKRHA
jgi:hypothetical protein